MSLMKNELEWVNFCDGQLSLKSTMPTGLPVIQHLQNFMRLPSNELNFFLLIIVERRIFYVY